MKFLNSKTLNPIIAITFLFMILSRLTWLQLRHYPIEPLGFLSPQVLDFWQLKTTGVRTWNINTIIVLFFLAAHMIRILSRSWISALFAATVLMSRGVVLARVGWHSMDLSLSLIAVAWLTFLAHYLRTASHLSRVASWLLLFGGSVLEPSFAALALAMPLYRFALSFKSSNLNSQNLPRASLLGTLPLTYREWLRAQTHPNRDSFLDLVVFLGILVFIIGFRSQYPVYQAAQTLSSFLDLHYIVSVLLILVCAIYGWKKQDHLLDFQSLFLSIFILWLIGAGVESMLGLRHFSIKAILLWLEPVVLCLGIACAVYIFQEGRRILEHRKWARRVSNPPSP